jgi:hypothetical protein
MITLSIRYTIDPRKRSDFERYAGALRGIIPRCGGVLVGYWLPTKFAGPTNLMWKDRPSSVFFMGRTPPLRRVVPEGADVGPDEAASTTNQADIRGLPGAEPHDRGSSGAASV